MNLKAWYRRCCYYLTVMLVFQFQFSGFVADAQPDTLNIKVQDAEKLFLQNNLSLLAAKYNIDANRALIKQAKLWDNPVISADQNIYDDQGKFFKHDNNSGQVYVQVMQLIKTAGKRNKLAQLAEDNTILSAEQFDELLRTLRYTLIGDLFEISHQLSIKDVYKNEINELQKLSSAMDIQLKSGNISLKDDVRIKALVFNLDNEVIASDEKLISLQSEVKLLLKNSGSAFINPSINIYSADVARIVLPDVHQLIDSAIQNRPDAKIARSLLDYQNHNLTYQKALAKPDISIGSEYDQRSSYAPNYVGLAVSFPLNILNKNQGNINSAKFNIRQQEVASDAQTVKIENEISSAYNKVKFYQQINNTSQSEFTKQYDLLFKNMLNSYQLRQVGLLELIDFIDAYKETKLKLLEQHSGLIQSVIDLNYFTGTDVIILN